MSELTKEYFEKQFRLQKEYFEAHLERRLMLSKEHFDEKIEELARAVAHGFHDVDKSISRLEKQHGVLENGHGEVKVKVRTGFEELRAIIKKIQQGNQKVQVGQDRLYDLHQKDDREIIMLRGYYHRLDDRVTKLESAGA